MSRTPIRDALRRLALGGIVIPLTTGGYVRRRVTLREVEELHELLLLLEPVAVRMTAAREPAVIRELLESEAVTSRDPFPIANARFHIALAEASDNVVLSRVVATLNERLVAEHQLVKPGGTPAALADGHELIIDALRNRDPDAAEAAMRRHIELGRDLLSRHIRSAGTPDA
jgi:DNA-binding GntR family transcriptional regulator